MDDKLLESLGIDAAKFKAYATNCSSTYSFPSVVMGGGENVVHCQMRGEHKRHKAIYHGFPYEWEERDTDGK